MRPPLLLLALLLATAAALSPPGPAGVLASSVSALTLRRGELAIRARTPTVSALRCLGRHCEEAEAGVMQCKNVGSDDMQMPQWKCEAVLKDGYRLDTTSVSCEGLTRPGDPYMLKGSCAVDYTVAKIAVAPAREPSVWAAPPPPSVP